MKTPEFNQSQNFNMAAENILDAQIGGEQGSTLLPRSFENWLSEESIENIIYDLDVSLRNNDFESDKLFELLKEHLMNSAWESEIKSIEKNITRFEYQEAQKKLVELANRFSES